MTFGAMAAWQAWLLLAAPLARRPRGCSCVKLRPPRMLIPSLLLWRRVLDESREVTLWERIRRAVSLVVTVAIALALALAVTRPALRSGAPERQRGRLSSSSTRRGRCRGARPARRRAGTVVREQAAVRIMRRRRARARHDRRRPGRRAHDDPTLIVNA